MVFSAWNQINDECVGKILVEAEIALNKTLKFDSGVEKECCDIPNKSLETGFYDDVDFRTEKKKSSFVGPCNNLTE